MGSLQLDNIDISFGGTPVISSLSLTVQQGEIASLLGPSGVGKTTILRTIAGLLKPMSGRILLDGKEVNHIPPEQRDVVLIFQKPLLFPFLDVFGNIAFGLKMEKRPAREIHSRIQDILQLTGLSGLEHRKIHQLSGGQQQRVALARGLVLEPSILLLDEPFSNLDAELRQQMRDLLLKIRAQTNTAMLFVTHDQGEALEISDTISLILEGRLKQTGKPGELFYTPADEAVARFFGCTNIIPGSISDGEFTSSMLSFSVQEQNSRDALAIIRPEQIQLFTQAVPASIEAEVAGIRFEGSISQLKFNISGHVITVATFSNSYSMGQRLWLHFPPDQMHTINNDK